MTEQPDFSTTVSQDDGRTVITIAGEIDIATAPLLWDAIDRAMASGASDVILDMAAVPFMDSTGLGIIVKAINRFGDTAVTLRSPQARILKVVTVAGVLNRLNVIEVDEDPA